VGSELARASQDHQPVSVLMVDPDHGKKISDHPGHLAGDIMLRAAARRMASAIRRYDFDWPLWVAKSFCSSFRAAPWKARWPKPSGYVRRLAWCRSSWVANGCR
jgi:hypothetical protein